MTQFTTAKELTSLLNWKDFEPMFGSWSDKMKPLFQSGIMDPVYAFLKARSSEGRIILPAYTDVFKAFQETPISELKTVILCQDPYPYVKDGKNVADGIGLSCGNTKVLQPSLELFYEGIKENFPELKKVKVSPDLTYLCNQGVMLLNTSLTVELNRPGSHSQIQDRDKTIRLWEPFMRYFFSLLTDQFKGLVICFLGKEAQYYERFLNPLQHYIMTTEHPAASARAERAWRHNDIFRKINRILSEDNKSVNWLNQQR